MKTVLNYTALDLAETEEMRKVLEGDDNQDLILNFSQGKGLTGKQFLRHLN